jgi:UDP-N-acetylglucosamine 2-epimerase
METVEDGWNVLTGANSGKIIRAIKDFNPTGDRGNHYGDGKAVQKISRILES